MLTQLLIIPFSPQMQPLLFISADLALHFQVLKNDNICVIFRSVGCNGPVSYTHLDVYKRQAYPMGLHFAGNKNTFYVFLLYTYKALNYFILFIHINLCLWQHFLHGFIITGPVSVSYTHLDVYKRQALWSADWNSDRKPLRQASAQYLAA